MRSGATFYILYDSYYGKKEWKWLWFNGFGNINLEKDKDSVIARFISPKSQRLFNLKLIRETDMPI